MIDKIITFIVWVFTGLIIAIPILGLAIIVKALLGLLF